MVAISAVYEKVHFCLTNPHRNITLVLRILLSAFELMLYSCVNHINNACRKSSNAFSHNEELIDDGALA